MIINLPKPEELSYNLDRLPVKPDERRAAMKSLAKSVLEYSQQIDQLFGEVVVEREEDPHGDKLPQ